jgi:hypothetical protein
MSLESMAGLGACRGTGESLASWLRAGPLPLTAWTSGAIDCCAHSLSMYCPGCVVGEKSVRRHYSRAEWLDPRRVICNIHNIPLIQALAPPKHLTTPNVGCGVQSELLCLVQWIEEWISLSPCTLAGRLILSPNCLQDQILRSLTLEDEAGCTLALSDWRLWLEGWPVPAHPHGGSSYQVGSMSSQTDRLAIVATTWKVWTLLVGGRSCLWPALPISYQAFCHLKGILHEIWPRSASRLPLALVADEPASKRLGV